MGRFFRSWSLREARDDAHQSFLMRTLWVQTALALTLCFLVLTSALALVQTDRRITKSIQGLVKKGELERQLEAYENSIEERYPAPSLIVFVSASGLRRDRLGVYGHTAGTTPNLDELASESIVFETAFAQASHALVSNKSILTGLYPSTLMLDATGADLVTLAGLESPREYLVRTFVGVHSTLPAQLRAQGYRTAGFTDGDWVCRENGFARGFEHFEENAGGLPASIARVREHLYDWRGERAFVFVHTSQLECPFPAAEPFRSLFCTEHSTHSDLGALCRGGLAEDGAWTPDNLEALGAHYDGAVAATDAQLAELVALLKELDVYDRTLLVVTSAHGTSLGERGAVGAGGLALEQLLVPMLIKFPLVWAVTPQVNAEPIELVDVMPTLMGSCGLRPPRGLDGQSFLSIALRNVRGREYLFAQTTIEDTHVAPASGAKRTLYAPGQWQVVHDPAGNEVEFFALADDPLALEPIRDLEGIEVPAVLQRLLGRPAEAATRTADTR